ncbi:MAG TPA: GDP-mannose 4,6-dehydratase [Acidobacteriaceae bacterium]|jgi:CDP-paratose 2-epimerase|nr:GDP-mannose 4,6-dehydratase [Acidobacteriaceae bacterium]
MAKQSARTILITGGAGFIGSNLAERLLAEPAARVRIFDDLSRRGVGANLDWLQGLDGAERLEFVHGDVRNAAAVAKAAREVTEIYHFAAQVAVTTSVDDPRSDFEVNVGGTFNVLEAARRSGRQPFVLFTSTNKVYGSLHGVPVTIDGSHYRAARENFHGVTEEEPLDFHSPYGCSKGAADQYVRDYARMYHLPTVVFRMSCIAGPRQFGTEDQGWVAHFLYSVLEGQPITIYGDGCQVRDVLHVHDLLDAMEAVRAHGPRSAGEIYNLGGGMERAVSVLEMLGAIERTTGRKPTLRYSEVRPGDQPLYISDTGKLASHTGWHPRRSLRETLEAIHSFWMDHRKLLGEQRRPELVQEVA